MKEITTTDKRIEKEIQKCLGDASIVLLRGVMGSGKTTVVRKFIESYGNATQVTSPTFSLMLSYESKQYGMIYHYDMYRKDLQEMLELGLLDMLDKPGLHFVEWGEEDLENILKNNGFKTIIVRIATTDNDIARRNSRVCVIEYE